MKISLGILYFLVLVFAVGGSIAKGQAPAGQNFSITFENNYNNDQLGTYQRLDFAGDWNLFDGSSPVGNVQILNDDANHQKVMRTYFPQGTMHPTNQHGYTWYSPLVTQKEELYFSYDVRFKPGFQWVLGGKIPGLVGGAVTSGQLPTATSGFSVRMVWKEQGQLLFYVYHPDQTNIYGDVYFFPGFNFETGKWYNLTMRIVLNSVVNGTANADGILEGFVDGKLAFQKGGFRFRRTSSIKIDRMYICSFFGGNTPEWVTVRDEWIDVDNFVAFQYSSSATNVPRGSQLSSASKVLLHPYYGFGATVPAVPHPPTALSSTSLTTSSASMSWTDNCSSESGFKIECRPDASTSFTEVGSVTANTTTFTHSGLNAGCVYHYRVKAFNSAGSSSYSNILDATTTPAVTNSQGLIAHYPLDNSAADISGNNFNGTLVNGPTYSTTNKQGTHSLLLDGVDDYVQLATMNLGNQFTIASWVYIPSGTSNIRTIASNTVSGSTSNGFKLMINTYGTSDRKIILETGNGTQSAQTASPLSTFEFDKWNHIAVKVNKTNGTARIYYNGVDVTSVSAVAPNFASNLPLRLAAMGNTVYNLKSNMDDVRIYGKELTAAEITALAATTVVPAAPQNLSATLVTNTVRLSWTDQSSNEESFKLERSQSATAGFSQINLCTSGTVTYTDQSVTAGNTYYYRVASVNSAGVSAYSNVCSIAIPFDVLSGLAAHYTFENAATDITGNGHNGTLVNGPVYSTLIKEGTKSILFDGTNDYMNIGTFNLGNQFTFATWAYIPSGSSNIRTLLANTTSGASSNGFKICVNTYGTTDRKIIVETGNGTTNASASTAASAVVFDRWNHIAVTINKSTSTARIYLNGTDITANSAILSNFTSSLSTRIGIMTNNTFPLKGNLDDTRIYSRILTASEISALTTLPGLKSTSDEEFATAVFVTENVKGITPVVYPNPFTDYVMIKSIEKISSIEVFNLQGAKIYEKHGIDSFEVPITDMVNSGSVYLLKISLENKEVHTLKILRK